MSRRRLPTSKRRVLERPWRGRGIERHLLPFSRRVLPTSRSLLERQRRLPREGRRLIETPHRTLVFPRRVPRSSCHLLLVVGRVVAGVRRMRLAPRRGPMSNVPARRLQRRETLQDHRSLGLDLRVRHNDARQGYDALVESRVSPEGSTRRVPGRLGQFSVTCCGVASISPRYATAPGISSMSVCTNALIPRNWLSRSWAQAMSTCV